MELLNNITCNPIIPSEKYIFNGIAVPRVTEIISSMLHENYLMGWANHLGFKRKNYKSVVEQSANIGTYSHNAIEKYLTNGDISLEEVPSYLIPSVSNTLQSFIKWYDVVTKNNKVEILQLEQELVCQWFGGTLDLLVSINDKIYLVDFKTSNHISYKYFIQMSAYKYMLTLNNIHIDGIILLQLSKVDINFSEYILLMDNPEHLLFIDNCLNTFIGLVYGYYNRLNVEQQYSNIFT